MRYVVVESSDPQDRNKAFDLDLAPRIGAEFRLRNGRSYRVLDIELAEHRFTEARLVRALVRRLN